MTGNFPSNKACLEIDQKELYRTVQECRQVVSQVISSVSNVMLQRRHIKCSRGHALHACPYSGSDGKFRPGQQTMKSIRKNTHLSQSSFRKIDIVHMT